MRGWWYVLCSWVSMVTSVTWQNTAIVKYAIQGSKNKWETFVALWLCKTILYNTLHEKIWILNMNLFSIQEDMGRCQCSTMIFVKTDLHLGVSWGVACTVGFEREKQPTLAIQLWDVWAAGREMLYIFLSGNAVFFSGCRDKGLSCCGSWELELISPGWDTVVHQTIARCHQHRNYNSVSVTERKSSRCALLSEYKLWSEKNH